MKDNAAKNCDAMKQAIARTTGYSCGISKALEMNPCRALVCLSMASFAWPSTAGAQSLPAPALNAQHPDLQGATAYSCVDPSDALARRKVQVEPCKWPMYQLPARVVSSPGEPPRLPNDLPKSSGPKGDHAMFWRFPVQPLGPYDAPRHTWR